MIIVTLEFFNAFFPAVGPTKSPIQCEPQALFPGAKWLGREVKSLRT